MELTTPLALGGEFYLVGVTVGRDEDSQTVRDCLVCDGHTFDDEFHLVGEVHARGDSLRRHYFCDADCLHEWLRLFPGT